MLPPKPAGVVFGIRADGKLKAPGFPSAAQAESAAMGLFEKGHENVEIVDRVTMEVVKVLKPNRR